MQRTLIVSALLMMAACMQSAEAGSSIAAQSIEDLIRNGITAELNVYVPGHPVCPGPVPQDVRNEMLARLPTSLSGSFASPLLEADISRAAGVLADGASTPACQYGAGVEWVHLSNVTGTGSMAKATGLYRTWSRVAQWQ